jgi:hypothetical protein
MVQINAVTANMRITVTILISPFLCSPATCQPENHY